nr:microsomal glutathione s-transferase 3 [Quercus suber]
MAGVELLLPKEYGYVAFVLVFDCLSNLWMAAQVGKARKRFKVPYPTLYALESENKDAKLFNCVQAILQAFPRSVKPWGNMGTWLCWAL